MKHIPPTINPETLPADLRERARLRRLLARGNGDLTDAAYLEAAANEIERQRAQTPLCLVVPDESDIVSALNTAGIQIVEMGR
jgi:hypothetical protein